MRRIFLVGGTRDLSSSVRKKLEEHGVVVTGAQLEGSDKYFAAPPGTDTILVASDFSAHDQVKRAKKLKLRILRAPFRSWAKVKQVLGIG